MFIFFAKCKYFAARNLIFTCNTFNLWSSKAMASYAPLQQETTIQQPGDLQQQNHSQYKRGLNLHVILFAWDLSFGSVSLFL